MIRMVLRKRTTTQHTTKKSLRKQVNTRTNTYTFRRARAAFFGRQEPLVRGTPDKLRCSAQRRQKVEEQSGAALRWRQVGRRPGEKS